jgi:hypothetical protein
MPSEEDPLLPTQGTEAPDELRSNSKYAIFRSVGIALVFGSLLVLGFFAIRKEFVPKIWQRTKNSYYENDALEMEDDEYKGRYTATQFISFTINTMGGSAEHGECEGLDVDPKSGLCYLGNKNITKDVLHRFRIIEESLRKLVDHSRTKNSKIDPSPKVLKIFMVPEFFFRGPNGAYSVEDMRDDQVDDSKDGVLIQASDRMRAFIADDAFQDFLFVFGTTIIAQSLDNNPEDNIDSEKPWMTNNTKGDQVLYYNFAPVAKGGRGHNHHYLFQKKYISGVDFLSRTKLPNPRDSHVSRYADPWEELEKTLALRGTTIVDKNIIELDGIRIGLEICLDHRIGVLWNTIASEWHPHLVDVQLITSAGMSIQRGPNPIVPGGVVYLTDGGASSAACVRTSSAPFDPETICRQKPDGLKHVPVGGPGYSNFIELAGCLDLENTTLLHDYYSIYQDQGCAYTLKTYGIDVMDDLKFYPPSLEIYPTVDLPL